MWRNVAIIDQDEESSYNFERYDRCRSHEEAESAGTGSRRASRRTSRRAGVVPSQSIQSRGSSAAASAPSLVASSAASVPSLASSQIPPPPPMPKSWFACGTGGGSSVSDGDALYKAGSVGESLSAASLPFWSKRPQASYDEDAIVDRGRNKCGDIAQKRQDVEDHRDGLMVQDDVGHSTSPYGPGPHAPMVNYRQKADATRRNSASETKVDYVAPVPVAGSNKVKNSTAKLKPDRMSGKKSDKGEVKDIQAMPSVEEEEGYVEFGLSSARSRDRDYAMRDTSKKSKGASKRSKGASRKSSKRKDEAIDIAPVTEVTTRGSPGLLLRTASSLSIQTSISEVTNSTYVTTAKDGSEIDRSDAGKSHGKSGVTAGTRVTNVTARSHGTQLSRMTASKLPQVKEPKVAGPKYYVATRKGQTKVIHEAAPSHDVDFANANEKGYEVLDYPGESGKMKSATRTSSPATTWTGTSKGTGHSNGTQLSRMTASKLPQVKESDVAGPKYYVAARKGQTKIVHQAAPAACTDFANANEKGYEVLDYPGRSGKKQSRRAKQRRKTDDASADIEVFASKESYDVDDSIVDTVDTDKSEVEKGFFADWFGWCNASSGASIEQREHLEERQEENDDESPRDGITGIAGGMNMRSKVIYRSKVVPGVEAVPYATGTVLVDSVSLKIDDIAKKLEDRRQARKKKQKLKKLKKKAKQLKRSMKSSRKGTVLDRLEVRCE